MGYTRIATKCTSGRAQNLRRLFSTNEDLPSRLYLSTSVTKSFSVPLTLADVYLRDEHLPFAYAFREILDRNKLISSLEEVLHRYPIVGASPDFSHGTVPTLECNFGDVVPVSFSQSEMTLDEWLLNKNSGQMQHVGWRSGGGAPTLSPLFDDLASIKGNEAEAQCSESDFMCAIRITYFKGSGTAIGININHMLGDANSCFRLCQVWGRAMRGLHYPLGASNNRAYATLSGMITQEMALLLSLGKDQTLKADEPNAELSFYCEMSSFMNQFIEPNSDWLAEEEEVVEANQQYHEYARLQISRELLRAMKSYGTYHCSLPTDPISDTFVSTTDMITAMGWLIKRRISLKHDWNLSMVINLRNRGGIDAFGCIEDSSSIGTGVFGNALTSVVVKHPPSSKEGDIKMAHIWDAAVAIRKALAKRMLKVGDLQERSRTGKAANTPNQSECFSSTSWLQFPLWDIRFSDNEEGCLDSFYGRPSYPLPVGDTYSSIHVPCRDGGCTHKLLAPSRHVQDILALHKGVSQQFIDWSREREQN